MNKNEFVNMNKNEFIIPKNALLTCFSPFILATDENNSRNTIAYCVLLKNDITVDFNRPRVILLSSMVKQ